MLEAWYEIDRFPGIKTTPKRKEERTSLLRVERELRGNEMIVINPAGNKK